MRLFPRALSLSLLIGATAPAWATPPEAKPGPSVPPPISLSRAQFAEDVAILERQPLSENTLRARIPLFKWVVADHSVLVTLCPSKTPEDVVAAQRLPELILWTQTILADAADQINHPAASAQAHEVAGLKSALRTYQAIRVAHPEETQSDWGDRLVTEVNAEGETALVKRTCAVTEGNTKGDYERGQSHFEPAAPKDQSPKLPKN